MKVSVIVPIYNVESYIYECVTSLLNQTLQDIEIILVNDGSTDNSIIKIKKLIEENNNITLINKKNGGLSSARNVGLEYVTGKYTAFIDSDDYIEPSFLEKLYQEAVQYDLDIAIGGYKKLYNNHCFESIYRDKKLYNLNVTNGIEFLKNEIECNDYRMEVWDDLYKTEFLKENHLKFEEGLLHEDELFTPLAFIKAKRVKLISTSSYIYRQRENSIMSNKPNINHIKSYQIIINKFLSMFYETSSHDVKYIISRLLINLCGGYETKIFKSEITKKIDLLKELRNEKLIETLNYENGLTKKQIIRYYLFKVNINIFYLYAKLSYEKKNREDVI